MKTCKDIDVELSLYEWAKEDSRNELASGLLYLQKIKSPTALSTYTYINSLKEEDRRILINSLVSRRSSENRLVLIETAI